MITGTQMKAARALLELDQKDLAVLAGVSVPTIQRMEASEGIVRGVIESLTRVISAIERSGVELIGGGAASNGGGRGVRLKQSDAADFHAGATAPTGGPNDRD